MSALEQQESAWRIDGRRCEPIEARLPQSDWITADLEAEEELMRVTPLQVAGAIVVLLLSIAASATWPMQWFAGWLP